PGAEQILLSRLALLAWLGHSPSPRFAAAEPSESRSAAQGNRKTELQENSAHKPQILQFQSRYPPQSTCQINGLRIVHGRQDHRRGLEEYGCIALTEPAEQKISASVNARYKPRDRMDRAQPDQKASQRIEDPSDPKRAIA
ncbi:hypothetical protein, partial [Mesorhizobium sp. M00.F.Ca.ET.216.01.1.1]|uniref:hypothetical protein n=1 Tax=Mesorhizobium sp. M00.F.Ca.ET.216.01.1.1 TaxID=2500528 RepID=UPI001AEDDB42